MNVFDTEKVLRLVMVVALYEERTITNAFHLHGTSHGLSKSLAIRNGFSGKVCEGAAVKEMKRGHDFEVQWN